jgi:AmmeMemoRadiSam system protein B
LQIAGRKRKNRIGSAVEDCFMARLPVVADKFYPGDPTVLRQTVAEYVSPCSSRQKAAAVVVPHAGYVYSGKVAGETFGRVEIPETVIIIGPNHQGYGASIALGTEDWAMPMGNVPFAVDIAAAILQNSTVIVPDNTAHQYEHSLEVEVPFLQSMQPKLSIVPLVVSHISFKKCQEVAHDLALAISAYDGPVLLVASTDMTHYESREDTEVKDHLALQYVLKLDPEGLYNTVVSNQISMCGVIPATITLLVACEIGSTKAELVRYTDSGEVSGDTSQVVGYAGVVIS